MDNPFVRKNWPPYLAGVIIGLLQIPAFLIIKSALGVSSSYVSAAGYAALVFDKTVVNSVYFYKYMTSMQYAWQGSMLVGILAGAFISMKLSGARRESYSPVWRKAVGIRNLAQRLVMGFAGGFIMLFGARWAGGCTTGHSMSGSGQLVISSLVFTLAMFVGGICITMFYRKL